MTVEYIILYYLLDLAMQNIMIKEWYDEIKI